MRFRPSRRWGRAALAVAALLLVAGTSVLATFAPSTVAHATVRPKLGFRATVLGWSSWYGSYDMGALGPAWCIDHGLHAPDPAFTYVPTIATDVEADTAAAISWIVATHGSTTDPVEAAAVMLVVHDLRRASYPFGVIDVDTLRLAEVAGFGGHEAELIARARAIKVEARAHRGLRAPFHLALELEPSRAPEAAVPSGPATAALDPDGRAKVTLTDAGGRPVVGAGIALEADGAVIDGTTGGGTGADGTFVRGYRLTAGPMGAGASFHAHALLPAPVPATYVSSTVRAQRVVRASWLGLEAHASSAPPPSTTTSSTSTTSTSSTSTTSTSSTSTTSTSTTSTSTSSTTTSTQAPPTIPPPITTGSLPRTGATTTGWALIGGGLVLLGATLVAVARGARSDGAPVPR